MRFAILPSILVAALIAGCNPGGNPVNVNATPTAKPSAGVAARPASIPAGSYETTKIRLQKFRNVYFKEKATGSFIPPRLAATLKQDEVTLEAGDFDELLYDNGTVRYAFYGRTEREQPYVVIRKVDKAAYQALEDGINEDGFWGYKKEGWDAQTRFPFYYLLYTVGDAGYEAGMAPDMKRMRKAGPILEGYLAEMAGGKLSAGVEQTVFATVAENGTLGVRVSTVSPDVAGDPIEIPYALRSVEVDAGKGFVAATVPDGTNGFTFPQPANGGVPVSVTVKLVGADSQTRTIALPVRGKK